MNNSEIAKNNMYKKVKTFLINNEQVFTGFKRLQTQITLYFKLNDQLDGYVKSQNKVTTGVTDEKGQTLTLLIGNTVRTCRKLLVYAMDKNDQALTAVFDVRSYDFEQIAYADAVSRIEGILESMQGIKEPLDDYMVSAEEIAAIQDGVTACQTQQGNPGDAASARQAATKGIKTTMEAIDACLAILDDLIENGYGEEYAALIDQYHNNRRIDHTGLRHSGVNAIVSSGGVFAEGVLVQITGLNKSATSDINGIAEISPMTPGTYHVIFSGKEYETQTLTLKILKGRILQVSVEMKKA